VIQEKKLLKRINQELVAGNPAWKIIVLKNSWLCPYCGEIGADGLRMEDSLEQRIAHHLLAACPAFDDFRAKPLEKAVLDRKAALITLRRKVARSLASDVRWQVAGPDGRWVCPFCARSTKVALARAVGGVLSDSQLDEAARGIVRHLALCEAYAGGKGREQPLERLAQEHGKAEREKRVRKIQQQLARDGAWRLRDMEKRWLCPFCALPTEIRFEKKDEPSLDLAERVAAHLDACAAHRQLEGRPRTERYLKDRVIAINRDAVLARLKRKLETHAIWQWTDADDIWYCPYCGKATGVLLPQLRGAAQGGALAPGGVPDLALNEVWAHLSSCPDYAGKRAQLRSRGTMRNIVAAVDRQIRLRREVRRAFAEDPRFSVQDPFGSWLCPYCRKVQKQIAVAGRPGESARGASSAAEQPLLGKTLEQVVTHLLDQCPRYIEGAQPEATLEALREHVALPEDRLRHGSSGGAGVPASLTASAEEDWIQKIDREVAALKSQVEVSAELSRSLEDARARQLRLLPRLPEVPGFEFGMVYRPCSTVGGDFYDFIRVSEHELGIAIGDISGHGIEAALLVGLAKKLLEIHGRGRRSPGETLLLANADIYPDLDAKTFVTVFYAILDTRTRAFRFSRAGHNPLVVFNPARTPRLQVLDSKGMALGMDAGAVFQQSIEEVEVRLEPGDLVFLYTDGVVESMNHEKEEFGLERLYATIEQYGHNEAEYVLYQIEKAILDFREGARQKDDVTMLALRVL
jgi:serine phosphatase RsbU (regulator of sigma subunit)/rubredoxin